MNIFDVINEILGTIAIWIALIAIGVFHLGFLYDEAHFTVPQVHSTKAPPSFPAESHQKEK